MQDITAKPADHPSVKHGKVGVLLVNLGTPDGTDYTSMRRYLREFLTDKRVIEWPRFAWYPILFGIVLNTRPGKVGKAYETIWNKEKNESFLRTYTRSQAELMAQSFCDHPDVVIDWAMRYGQPSIASRMEYLQKAGCDRILVFPLYPQYAAATTATVCDEAFKALSALRDQPALRVVPPYYDDAVYIEAIAASIEAELRKLDFTPEVILASFHGIPKSYADDGDPYPQQCAETVRLLRQRLRMGEDRLMLTFQSRFGKAEWLQPYTDKTVEALAQRGVRNLAVVTPGFSADCLETLEEIAVENAEIFHAAGGVNFAAIPCLNDGEGGMAVIVHLAMRELQGWI